MSFLGDNKSTVKDAVSTDLSSLLNVLEWMTDAAFGGTRRVDLNLVKDLRSEVRNSWAHAPKQEMTDEQLENAFQIATKFLDDLDKVAASEEVKKCIEDIKFLQANGLTNVIEAELKNLLLLRQELCGDVTEMKEEIKSLKENQNSGKEAIQEHEIKLKSLEDFMKECCSRMEEQSTPKSCLPEKLATFTARDEEVQKTISFLMEKGHGIVSIIGGPGFGKSTIAVEVSHRLNEQHGILVIFSYLSTASTVDEVILRLCRDVGVNPGEDPKSSLIFWLRNIKKNVVLVMDNIEQLLEGEEKRSQFDDLMRLFRKNSGPQLQFITTSRTKFSIADLSTNMVPVNEMDSDSSMELLRKFSGNEEMEDDYLHEIASLCGHVPLALCIAASRIQEFEDPNDLITSLKDEPMEVLKAPESNRYVQKAIKMSFEKLSNEDKKSFVRLSVFDGNFDQDAAEEIIDRNMLATKNFLKNLINRSLLQRSGGRFSIHLLVKRFLTDYDQLEEEEREKAQELMVEYFLKICHSLTLNSYSKDGFNGARESLKKDAHNVEKILKVCQAQETNPNSNIIECLARSDIYKSSSRFFYNFVGNVLPHKVMKDFLQYCVELAKRWNQLAIAMNFQCILADQEGHSSGWNKSPEYVDMMERIIEEFANEEVLKEDNALLSYYYYSYGRYLFNKVKVPTSESVQEVLREADECLQKSLDLRRQDQVQFTQNNLNYADEVITLRQLGRISNKKRKFDKNTIKYYQSHTQETENHYREALMLAKNRLGDHELTSYCHKDLGDLFLSWKKNDLALTSYKDAKDLCKKLGLDSSEFMANLLKNCGSCLSYLNRCDESVQQLNEALDITEKLAVQNEYTLFRADIYSTFARILNYWKPDGQAAKPYARKAIEMQKFLNENTLVTMKKIVEKGEETLSK